MKILLSSNGRANRGRRGFTMVEIAICLAIIGFALVAIIGILPIGMSVQKDNREETVINFDAKYLLDTIRSGSYGQDELTNYVISITNNYAIYQVLNGKTNLFQPARKDWYNISGYFANNISGSTNFLVSGSNIVGVLTTPKYVALPKLAPGAFQSNSITADFRAITGSPMDQGHSQTSRDFAFSYRIFSEVIPFAVPDPSLTNFNEMGILNQEKINRSNYMVFAGNMQANLNEVRLQIRWPILPNGHTGPGVETYRAAVGGHIRALTTSPLLYYFQPQAYAAGTLNVP